MKSLLFFLFCAVLLTACDNSRVFEKNEDFKDQSWLVSVKPEFEFSIPDTLQRYNVYCNVRNDISYPYSRLFITYYLQDSIGKELQKKLIGHMLFDPKTGKPQGVSGLGDIYDHQILLLNNYKFSQKGKHKIKFEQFMRTDTLQGILAVGARVEYALNK